MLAVLHPAQHVEFRFMTACGNVGPSSASMCIYTSNGAVTEKYSTSWAVSAAGGGKELYARAKS